MRKGDSRFCFCFFSKRFRLQVRRAEREVSGLRGAPERQFSASATSTSWRVGDLEMNETSRKQAEKMSKNVKEHISTYLTVKPRKEEAVFGPCVEIDCVSGMIFYNHVCVRCWKPIHFLTYLSLPRASLVKVIRNIRLHKSLNQALALAFLWIWIEHNRLAKMPKVYIIY